MRADLIEQNAKRYFRDKPSAISQLIDVNASGVTAAISIASGTYVTKVGVWATTPVDATTTGGINVGDGVRTDRYIDGLISMSTNDIIYSPTITGTNPRVRTDEVHGHYYSGPDTIDVLTTNTFTGAGTIRVMAWYYTVND
jgi:hypothetical protein